jgi:hypothetical protein
LYQPLSPKGKHNSQPSGSLTLWLDDVQKQSLTFIDNDTRTITEVRLGVQGIETGTRGTLYFDDFESRRFSYIGTLTDPGVDDPTATNQAGWFAKISPRCVGHEVEFWCRIELRLP